MTPRDRKALLLGGAVVLGAVLLLRVIPWGVRSVLALRARTLERVETLARARDALATAPALRDSLTHALGAVVALAPRLVDGRTAAEASASLSALVSMAARRHQVRLVRLDPVPDSAAGAFRRVAVHAELEGDVRGLTRFLRAVETGDPLLTLPMLAVLAPDPLGRSPGPEMLRAEVDVTGFFLPRETR
ncbi:MAG: type II secretion system protein GspM [Gemmatimonadales bacterium]